jgi:hypothetical protein
MTYEYNGKTYAAVDAEDIIRASSSVDDNWTPDPDVVACMREDINRHGRRGVPIDRGQNSSKGIAEPRRIHDHQRRIA